MDEQERDDLKKAYKKEKDLRVRARILAVNMVYNEGFKINEAAACLMQCPDWVGIWIQRFNTDGLDGLRDLPTIWQTAKDSTPRNEQNNETGITNTDNTCNTLPTNISENKSETTHDICQRIDAQIWLVIKTRNPHSHKRC